MTNQKGRSGSIFGFYNDRGECENRIEEFKNGFDADRLSCHRFRANAFRLLLHSSPTTSSTFSDCTCLGPGDRRKSKLCALRLFKWALASVKRLVASAFISPAVGLFNLSSRPSRSLSILLSPSGLFELVCTALHKAELFLKSNHALPSDRTCTQINLGRPLLTAAQPATTHSSAHFFLLMN